METISVLRLCDDNNVPVLIEADDIDAKFGFACYQVERVEIRWPAVGVQLFELDVRRKEAEVVFAVPAEWVAGEDVVSAADVQLQWQRLRRDALVGQDREAAGLALDPKRTGVRLREIARSTWNDGRSLTAARRLGD
jgi:hypothetical protein